jgi:hypothetical protein
MRFLDYNFSITDAGIEFTDKQSVFKTQMQLPVDTLCSGDLLEVTHLPDGRIFLRKVHPDGLEYSAFGSEDYIV